MMFWGCISGNGSRVLLKTPKRCKSADYNDLLKMAGIDTSGEDHFFMEYNCPIHRSRAVKQWLRDNGIAEECWPQYSPDFNPIESVWAQRRGNSTQCTSPQTPSKKQFILFGIMLRTLSSKMFILLCPIVFPNV